MERIKTTVIIPKDLRDKFYKKIVDKYGYTHGKIHESMEEAIELWLKEEEAKEKELEN